MPSSASIHAWHGLASVPLLSQLVVVRVLVTLLPSACRVVVCRRPHHSGVFVYVLWRQSPRVSVCRQCAILSYCGMEQFGSSPGSYPGGRVVRVPLPRPRATSSLGSHGASACRSLSRVWSMGAPATNGERSGRVGVPRSDAYWTPCIALHGWHTV